MSQCNLQDVGRTTRKLATKIGEHITNIRNGYKNRSVANHFRQAHNRDPTLLQVWGIVRVLKNWRGADMVKKSLPVGDPVD